MPKYKEISPITLKIIRILYSLKEGEEITRYKLTKKVFPEVIRDNKNMNKFGLNRILRGKDITVHNELLKLRKLGIINIIKHKRGNEYELLDDKVYAGSFKFPYNNGKKKALGLLINDKWVLLEE